MLPSEIVTFSNVTKPSLQHPLQQKPVYLSHRAFKTARRWLEDLYWALQSCPSVSVGEGFHIPCVNQKPWPWVLISAHLPISFRSSLIREYKGNDNNIECNNPEYKGNASHTAVILCSWGATRRRSCARVQDRHVLKYLETVGAEMQPMHRKPDCICCVSP